MAVAWDATGGGNLTAGSSASLATSWSHTIATSGATTMVIVAVSQSISTNSTSISCSVTYGGTAMNPMYYVNYGSGTNRGALGVYYLYNPPTGAQTVTATSGGTATKTQIQGQSVSYTGVVTLAKAGTSNSLNITGQPDITGAMAVAITANGAAITASNKTSRYRSGAAATGLGDYLSVQDASGSSAVSFTNTGTATTPRSFSIVLSPGGYPSVNTLTDNFSTQDTGKWFGWDVTNCNVTSGQLYLNCTASYYGINTNASYDFTNGSYTYQLLQVPNAGLGTTDITSGIMVSQGSTGIFCEAFTVSNNQLMVWRAIGSVTSTPYSVTYDAVKHLWLRITESSGTIYWWTSPDGIGWSLFYSAAVAFPITGVCLTIQSGFWGAETTPGSSLVDNVNVSNNGKFLSFM